MNENILEGKWKEFQGIVQKTWGKLTNDDLTRIKGSIKELNGKLQEHYGYDEETAGKEIEKLIKENNLKD
ncbi:MAG TPA: CsbD family protein [Gammaproteobacteria bacterium]|nr:CsbD family protein [Gammaproteobacteria bacterium]